VVIVLHGGPAAVGEAAAIACGLADSFRVLEPWQRGSGDEPLTVSRHVADLDELIDERCAGTRPALVGESWGAMLALAYAAEHPQKARAIVLIGCGTFDEVSRLRMRMTLDERVDEGLRDRLEQLERQYPDPNERLKKRYELTKALYDFDAIDTDRDDEEIPLFDMRAHTETWNDMLRLQKDGIYPAAFAAIKSPVLMLHGAHDPHPGPMTRATLSPYLPQIEYHEWERCGHSPWLERAVRDEFFDTLRRWLNQSFSESA
jgi:pimeloyl-ACP methyl ester carboxylesterase